MRWRQAPSEAVPNAVELRVLSYNVLSDALADPKHHTFSDPADLDAERRLGRIQALLSPRMLRGSIVCLQEVSRTWAARLVPFWDRHNYQHVDALSGPPVNNYMGQTIAWPVRCAGCVPHLLLFCTVGGK